MINCDHKIIPVINIGVSLRCSECGKRFNDYEAVDFMENKYGKDWQEHWNKLKFERDRTRYLLKNKKF